MTATLLKFPEPGVHDDLPPLLTVAHPAPVKEHIDPPHILVRETPFYRYQDRLNDVLHYRAQLRLNADLEMDYANEASTPKTVSEWAARMDSFWVWVCRSFHRTPTFTPGDNFSRCPSCNRKYALPWADMSKVSSDVYICDDPFVGTTEPTMQTVCRNGNRND